jgi:hypothetical protein
MNTQTKRATSHRHRGGDFISEDAVRGALTRRQAADGQSPSARRTVPLRRWSVAELIARAMARPADSMSR